MTLEDLFVSHKQVDPIEFEFTKPSPPSPIYLNLNRAQKAATPIEDNEEVEDDMSTWKTKGKDDMLNWRVNTFRSGNHKAPTHSETSNPINLAQSGDYYSRLRDFIAKEEGFRSDAYIDGKYYSIGYGFNDPKYKKGDKMTKEEADKELDRQLKVRETKYRQRFGDKWDNLTDNQRIALMSYGYNTGDNNIINGSIAKYLDSGDMNALRSSIKINTAQGKYLQTLEDRRIRERDLFNS